MKSDAKECSIHATANVLWLYNGIVMSLSASLSLSSKDIWFLEQ